LASEIGATPVSVLDAAHAGELVIIAIPTKAVVDLPRGLFADVASSVVVIDTANYHLELRDGRIDAIDRGMLDSQWVAQQIGRPVVKAFNNILAQSLFTKGAPRGTPGRIALSACGDLLDARAAVLRLVDDLGFDAVDGGDLDNSWRQQPGAPAYCRDLEAAALRRALAQAERSGSPNTAPKKKLVSGNILLRRQHKDERVNEDFVPTSFPAKVLRRLSVALRRQRGPNDRLVHVHVGDGRDADAR
jgi:hypothetical protein